MAKETTIVTFLLDRTGSMASVKPQTIDSFNAYLKSLQEDKGDGLNVEFTFLQFDSISLDKICVGVPVKQVQPLNDRTFQPRDMTPLIDACVKTIKAVDAAVATRKDNPKVVICFQTDGHENASREYSWSDLNALIAEKTTRGWQFNFMGAGIDAYQQAAKMGINSVDTVSYSMDSISTQNAFAAAASNTRGFATGERANTSYTASQKLMAGDVFDPARTVGMGHVIHQTPAAQHAGVSQSMSAPLDLTTARPKTSAVEDFSLGQSN